MATPDKYATGMMEALANHITLPPQLPGRQDFFKEIENNFVRFFLSSLAKLDPNGEFKVLRRALLTSQALNIGSRLQRDIFITALREMQEGEFLILHIAEQNCGLVIRRDHRESAHSVLFEAFELSARSESVLATKNALQWTFPGTAVALSKSKFNEPSFQDQLSSFLNKASTESIKRFTAHTSKAGSSAYESRDTSDPSLVTQFLMALLEVNGTRVFPTLLLKRVRDDVCWNKAENPWRRSPFWLLLRVAIERHFATKKGGDYGRGLYKLLMCLVISQLLDDSLPHLHPEVVVHIKAKLCRRLAKLEAEQELSAFGPTFRPSFDSLRPIFKKSIDRATLYVQNSWNSFKTRIQRPVQPLPKRADERHLYLTLPNSGAYIGRIMAYPLHLQYRNAPDVNFNIPRDYHASTKDAKPIVQFARRYYSLSLMEEQMELNLRENASVPLELSAGRCAELSISIEKYITSLSSAYDSDSEQSSFMLLTIMDSWMSMDKCAIALFPLLEEYSPCFTVKMMEVLQLSRLGDLRRLRTLRSYLHDRMLKCHGSRMSIFDEPQKGCFAERYYDNSPDSLALQALHQRILDAAEVARIKKVAEWQEMSDQYEKLIKNISRMACTFTTDEFLNRVHAEKSCTKCFLERKSRRFRINVHEHPLPTDPIVSKAVIFELACPRAFALYRDTTWRILGALALLFQDQSEPPRLLQDYVELKPFSSSINSKFSLGSTAKSFLLTHYANPRFPVRLVDICLPNGLRWKYFDTRLGVWLPRTMANLSFERHCRLQIPSSSPFACLQFAENLTTADTNGPTSYEIVSSQTKCPSGLNVHEYMAYQALLSGKTRRWLQILIELGSSALNFGTEATTAMMRFLALQAGPSHLDDPRGLVHQVFRDPAFCRRFADQLDQRLGAISSNYRETNSMETLVTLILRLVELNSTFPDGLRLLKKSRKITFDWIITLRAEIQAATDAETSRRYSRYALWSALLNRRTFAIRFDKNSLLDSTEILHFIESSLTMQDNMVGDPQKLPSALKNAIVRDMKLIYRIRYLLRHSVEANPASLISSISAIWPDAEESASKSFSSLIFLEDVDRWWIQIVINATSTTMQQVVHFHLLEGHLLVMGKPIGKLPVEYRTSTVLSQLFGDQTLLTFPSALPGMAYRLAVVPNGYQIHLGFRGEKLVVRAQLGETILELIPSAVFGTNSTHFDLPKPLVEKCVHWLDVHTGIVEIRQNPIWKSKPGNWQLNFHTRRATRRQSTLVDPHSPLASRVAQIFDGFEYRHELVIFLPEYRPLTIELRRLELTFSVNVRNLLESSQLQAEIIHNQDAGTFYGLASKIVLREVISQRNIHTKRPMPSSPGTQRIVMVPMGAIRCRRVGPHVRVDVENNGDYAKYSINEILGRLDCPAEPRLLYLKALYHAFTSFVLPDTLTNRTGTEEAIYCLKSANCQPWTPLTKGPDLSLQLLGNLTPKRDYYPRDLKYMQNVSWDENLTSTIQSDEFREIVENIRATSEQLSLFAANKAILEPLNPPGDVHLRERSQARRSLYQRPSRVTESVTMPDVEYVARDRYKNTVETRNTHEIGRLLQNWPSKLSTTKDLAAILQRWPQIGGHNVSFDKILLSDNLDVEIGPVWGSLIDLCAMADFTHVNSLMFRLGLISFNQDVDMDVMRNLVAFAVLGKLKTIVRPPNCSLYTKFRKDEVPRLASLVLIISHCVVPYTGDERDILGGMLGHKQRRKFEAAELAHEQKGEADCKVLAAFILKQWPCAEFSMDGFDVPIVLDIEKAIESIRPEWLRLYQNHELSNFLSQVQLVLDDSCSDEEPPCMASEKREQNVFSTRIRGSELPSLEYDLLSKRSTLQVLVPQSTSSLNPNSALSHYNFEKQHSSAFNRSLKAEINELEIIFGRLVKSKSKVQQQQASDLLGSLDALRLHKLVSVVSYDEGAASTLAAAMLEAKATVSKYLDILQTDFKADDMRAKWLQQGGLWPAITPVTLLETLRSTSDYVFGSHMKENIVNYGISLTGLQRLMRLEDALVKKKEQKLNDEQRNLGHTNWNPHVNTDWLLLELESNMLLRETQIIVARATISPESGSNSVLQMNMGEGKTSCIIPMAAAVLANGRQLHRVIIPKPLLQQTAQILTARLGGLVGREIRHVPFSRKTSTTSESVRTFFRIHKYIQKNSGVMLALPEHLLSFSLSGIQRLSDDRINESKSMVKVQEWLHKNSRDVLDECDNILAIRTQLIYPSGSQKSLDGHPNRWEVVEALLSRVDGHLWNLQKAFPQSIEVVRRFDDAFPVAFFLRKDVEDELISRLVADIIYQRTQILPADCPKSDRKFIKHFISEPKVPPAMADKIKQLYPDKPAVRQIIHLLRGLFVHRIFLMVLKKRWNVQYGLHPGRDPIAVPFMAKGTPSEQAEWGHPDVMVTMTCLAFYYEGLSIAQLRQTLEHIVKSDDPSQAYDRFSQQSNLPDSLREWNAINVDDEAQVKEIWQFIRYDPAVIDYFLNNFVFPLHAKQFQMKLQASGWDLPLFSTSSSSTGSKEPQSTSLTTGFSGTNDGKRLMPLTIEQQDLLTLTHTNAEVLAHLLEPRNRTYKVLADPFGRHISETALLCMLAQQGIRVLIDAGAQILEMNNISLCKAWLEIVHEAPAAVYLDEMNKPFVMYRNGHKVPLLATPYADDLGDCLVYLDEAHTRGTDLKISTNAVGALTLGLGQTKDHTVQAAMRLRQLGTTQSVVFFAPPEVHQSIVDLCKKPNGYIDSSDVICWLLEQTSKMIEQLQPLYFSQGADFCRRAQTSLDNPDIFTDLDQRDKYLTTVRTMEQQTLEQLYGVNTKVKSSQIVGKYSANIGPFMKKLHARRKNFQDTGNAVHGSALQEVEQEREVAYEVEAVREVQKPVHYLPYDFPGLHRDIEIFAITGRVVAGSTVFVEAFTAMGRTKLGRKHGINTVATSSRLFVSHQFTRTINPPQNRPYDQFQRQVTWILWGDASQIALVVIPEEAELLLSLLGKTPNTPTHLLSYAAPITRKMLHFNDFQYYAVPSLPLPWQPPMWLRVELGIFSGRLYFEFVEYASILQFLAVKEDSAPDDLDEESEEHPTEVDNDDVPQVPNGELNVTTVEQELEVPKSFTKKPLAFLQEWLSIRRKGQDFAQTPMGFVCQGKPLLESHPFFSKPDQERKQPAVKRSKTTRVNEEDDDVDEDFDDDVFICEVGADDKDTFDDNDLMSENSDAGSGSD